MPNLQGYIFYSLQHFTTKLRKFSKRGMLFQAMVIFLPISIFFKILSERGKVHWGGGGSFIYVFTVCERRHKYLHPHIYDHPHNYPLDFFLANAVVVGNSCKNFVAGITCKV